MRILMAAFLATVLSSPTLAEDVYRAPISEGAYQPIPKSEKKLFKAWGKAGISRIDAAVKSAVTLTSMSPKCDEVFIGGLDYEQSAPRKTIVVFAQCANGERFKYTEAETKTAASPANPVSETLNAIRDSDALTACENIAKSKLVFKSTMDISVLNSNVIRNEYGISVTLSFEAKNSFGASLPYVAYCSMDGNTTTLLSIKEQ